MKSLRWVGILALIFNLGCGGYGSGMGMNAAPAPAIVPASGAYPTPLTVSIQDGLQGATIYVTVDGSMPTLSSPIYRGPFTITQSAKIQAIAVVNGYSTSPVGVANYTLQ